MLFACLALPARAAQAPGVAPGVLEAVARVFSPRVEVHAPQVVTLDIDGLQHLLGGPADIGRELQREVLARGAEASIAVAAARTTAMLLAFGRSGLTFVPRGKERERLAPLPLGVLARLAACQPGGAAPGDPSAFLALLRRWGMRTLGDLALLPAPALSERAGQDGVRWQRLARGEDLEPLVATAPAVPVEECLDLDWPVEGLEPLSFILPRLVEPICERLERLDQAAVALDLTFRLATRAEERRRLELPAPMRDAKVLRTLILLHLESHPLPAGVDRLALRVDTAPARVIQFSLLARAMPFPEQVATLVARLGALMGERRVGSAALVDSHRPGAFAMTAFTASEPAGRAWRRQGGAPSPPADPAPRAVLRRFRLPVPARVLVQDGCPVRVMSERRGLEGGRVETFAGPWRTSGEWWRSPERASAVSEPRCVSTERGREAAESRWRSPERGHEAAESKWDRDEWDVSLSDGAVYRVFRDRATERWFLDGIVD